jgi:hypothetical protein
MAKPKITGIRNREHAMMLTIESSDDAYQALLTIRDELVRGDLRQEDDVLEQRKKKYADLVNTHGNLSGSVGEDYLVFYYTDHIYLVLIKGSERFDRVHDMIQDLFDA